jgi:hypothetical protein
MDRLAAEMWPRRLSVEPFDSTVGKASPRSGSELVAANSYNRQIDSVSDHRRLKIAGFSAALSGQVALLRQRYPVDVLE